MWSLKSQKQAGKVHFRMHCNWLVCDLCRLRAAGIWFSKGQDRFPAQQGVVESLLLPKVSTAMYMCLQRTGRGTIASKISIETATVSWNKIFTNFYETLHTIFHYWDFLLVYFGLTHRAKLKICCESCICNSCWFISGWCISLNNQIILTEV